MKTTVTLTVNIKELIGNLREDEALELISVIDLKMASTDFTLNLLKSLIISLNVDMPKEEIENELKEIIKEIE